MALGAARAPLRRRQTLPRDSIATVVGRARRHDTVIFLPDLPCHHLSYEETSFREGTRVVRGGVVVRGVVVRGVERCTFSPFLRVMMAVEALR